MHVFSYVTALAIAGTFAATEVQAACSGGLGRGWASGRGSGEFTMTSGDKNCLIAYPAFINEAAGTRTPAAQIALTSAPKAGKIGSTPDGILYMPQSGFRGSDKFCIKNTTPQMPGKSLSGCVTVTVQ